jgi:hypothetical protein
MHTTNPDVQGLNDPAPRNEQSLFVAPDISAHQEAAMLAARMIRFQYSTQAKNRFRRECVNSLKASLARKHA